MKVAIIDYGMGNLTSVFNAFYVLGTNPFITRTAEDLVKASHVVLPGVGSFKDGIGNLKKGGWLETLNNEVIKKGKPFLGICLGLQLLASLGTEHGRNGGLGWVKGIVDKMPQDSADIRIPHIGWNDVHIVKRDGLYHNINAIPVYYFVHSYVLFPEDENVVSGTFFYGKKLVASIEKDNIYAVQFHPEKSQKCGMEILRNFIQKGGRDA